MKADVSEALPRCWGYSNLWWLWFNRSNKLRTTYVVTCLPCVEMRERIGRVKHEKMCGWRWRQFNGESKIPACKQSKRKNSFASCHGQGYAQPSPGELGLCHTGGWGVKRNIVTLNIPISFFTQLYSVIVRWCGVALSLCLNSTGEIISFCLVQIQICLRF